MMNVLNILTVIILMLSYNAYAQKESQPNKKQWIEDIDFLIDKAQDIVPGFDSRIDKTVFSNLTEQLKQNLETNSFEEIVFDIQYLLNTIEDEGCNIIPFQKELDIKVLPIKNYWFNDGFFICDVSTDYKNLIGEQIIKINGIEIDEVYSKLKGYLNADNEHYKKYIFPVYSMMPSLLVAAGIGNSATEIQLQFSSGKEASLKGKSITEYVKLNRQLANDEYFSFTKTDHQNENYWFEYVPETKTLFIQLQKIANNDNGVSFSAFIEAVETEIKKGNSDKIIVDVRYGGGGNGFKLKVFTDLLRDSEIINKKGNLFVLTSNATRGTLLELTSILSLNTKAIIVGEPTGEGPNTVGDTKYIKLPNSGISISLTQVYWPTSWGSDNRKTINPDVSIVYGFQQHSEKKDPWIDAALNYKNEFDSNKPIDKELLNKLIGSYKIEGRKASIKSENGKLFMSMKRKMKSFFEFKTELYFYSEGKLSTDIKEAFLNYKTTENEDVEISDLTWKGKTLSIKN